MSNDDLTALRRMISIVLEQEARQHKDSASERKEVHVLEWRAASETSLLGEVDDLSRIVCGVASSFRLEGPGRREDPEGDLRVLDRAALHRNEVMVNWLDQADWSFPGIRTHIVTIEYLRRLTSDALERWMKAQEHSAP